MKLTPEGTSDLLARMKSEQKSIRNSQVITQQERALFEDSPGVAAVLGIVPVPWPLLTDGHAKMLEQHWKRYKTLWKPLEDKCGNEWHRDIQIPGVHWKTNAKSHQHRLDVASTECILHR